MSTRPPLLQSSAAPAELSRHDASTERALLEKIDELSLLRTLSDRLSLAGSFSEGCRTLVEVLGRERGADRVTYHSIDWPHRSLRLEARWPEDRNRGAPAPEEPLDASPLAAALEAGAEDAGAVICRPVPGGSASVLAAAMRVRGTVNGILALHAPGAERDTEETRRLLSIVATAAASALDVSRWLEREDFIAMLRHDISNPIAVALGYGEMIADRVAAQGDPELDALIGSVVTSLTAVSELVSRYLDLTAIDRGAVALERGTIDLGEVAAAVVDRHRPSAAAKGVDLACSAAHARLHADRQQMGRLVENLVGNAIKYTPRGGRVGVEVDDAGATVALAVTDTGYGIAEKHHGEVFSRHARFHGELGIPGTGLGLSICKAIVEAHGGTIGLRSAPGRGSSFTVHLPR